MSSRLKDSGIEYTTKLNLFGHDKQRQCMKHAHDLGGQIDNEPIQLEERSTDDWEKRTYVTCECLGWRGVWNTPEKHRRHNDLGTKQYLTLPYYGRWILSAARTLVDKDLVTQTELMEKMIEIKKRRGEK